MGLILGAFFWTYATFNCRSATSPTRSAPASPGRRRDMVVDSHHPHRRGKQLAALTGYRLLLGVGEAGAYPSSTKINMAWFPRSERPSPPASSTAVPDRRGPVAALVAWIIGSFGWRMSFAVTGLHRRRLGGGLAALLPRSRKASLGDARSDSRRFRPSAAPRRRDPKCPGLAVRLPHHLGHDDRQLTA